jgi:hypothetical protein
MAIVLDGTSGITNDSGYTGDGVSFADSTPANTLVTTSGGNVGIGTSSPASTLTIVGPNSAAGGITLSSTTANATNKTGRLKSAHYTNAEEPFSLLVSSSTSTANNIQIGGGSGVENAATVLQFYTAADNTTLSGSERMRIDSSGNLLVGTTSNAGSRLRVVNSSDPGGAVIQFIEHSSTSDSLRIDANTGGTAGQGVYVLPVRTAGTLRGGIQWNGSNLLYNTSSDYRLKEDINPMTGALARVTALKPCTYKWKETGFTGQGFIAHELQEVVPECVTGEKDAVDAEGKPVYQGIDTSFLVATLTAAIQEQQAIITALTARVESQEVRLTSLEGAQA